VVAVLWIVSVLEVFLWCTRRIVVRMGVGWGRLLGRFGASRRVRLGFRKRRARESPECQLELSS
jgi:hypothetical protein